MVSSFDADSRKRILIVLGTRPEAIKLAPVVNALKTAPDLDVEVCITSQHRELVAPVLEFFQVTPDHTLGIGTRGQTPWDVTSRVTEGISRILSAKSYYRVVVQGDTSSALGGGLAGFYQRVPVAHVEAGLRSGDPALPFPEEGHRRMLDAFAEELFVPTKEAYRNLINEGVSPQRIHRTGNTVIDALLWARAQLRQQPCSLAFIDSEEQKLVLLTTHRRESFGAPMRRILEAVRTLAERQSNVRIVFPVHPNPRVRQEVEAILSQSPNMCLREPMNYPEMVQTLLRADLVLTDSGGLQEEAVSLGKKTLVLRETTERPEGVEYGLAELVGTDSDRILTRAEAILALPRDREDHWVPLYGDGRASERIRDVLLGRAQALKVA